MGTAAERRDFYGHCGGKSSKTRKGAKILENPQKTAGPGVGGDGVPGRVRHESFAKFRDTILSPVWPAAFRLLDCTA